MSAREILRWKYVIPSTPGEEVDEHLLGMRLIKPGVIGDKSNLFWTSGIAITSPTQFGRPS